MRILVIENYDGTDLGHMAQVFAERGVEADVVKAFAGAALPASPAAHDGMVVLGGGQNALDDEGSPYFPQLLDLMRAFDRADRPVLGICLGSQLLARAHGGGNLIDHGLEFGFHELVPLPAAAQDPLLGLLDGPAMIFQWHADTVTLPPGAAHLATSRMTPIQGFSVGRASFGAQFHFEVDRALIDRWTAAMEPFLDKAVPDWRETLPRQIEAHEPGALDFCRRFTNRWLDLCAARADREVA